MERSGIRDTVSEDRAWSCIDAIASNAGPSSSPLLADRSSKALLDHIKGLRSALVEVQKRWSFETVAMVVLPEHLHCIWTLPDGDADFSRRWQAIKAQTTRAIAAKGTILARYRNGEIAFWQRRFWEHTIRDEEDLRRHLDYIHFNPVKHGLVRAVSDWPHSSFHRHVFAVDCVLPSDWAGRVEGSDGGGLW